MRLNDVKRRYRKAFVFTNRVRHRRQQRRTSHDVECSGALQKYKSIMAKLSNIIREVCLHHWPCQDGSIIGDHFCGHRAGMHGWLAPATPAQKEVQRETNDQIRSTRALRTSLIPRSTHHDCTPPRFGTMKALTKRDSRQKTPVREIPSTPPRTLTGIGTSIITSHVCHNSGDRRVVLHSIRL